MSDFWGVILAIMSVAIGFIGGKLYERRWFKSYFSKDRSIQHEVDEKKAALDDMDNADIVLSVANDGRVTSVKPKQKTD